MNFKELATHSIGLNREFESFWKSVDVDDFVKNITNNEIVLLKELIIKRIDVLNSFEILCRVDFDGAKEILLRRYLGKGVNLYSKFGGVTYELSTILDDIVEIHGLESLKNILKVNEIDLDKLRDEQVILSLANALNLSFEETQVWLNKEVIFT